MSFNFIICNLIISVILTLFLGIKKICENTVSPRCNYIVNIFIILVMIIPFLPDINISMPIAYECRKIASDTIDVVINTGVETKDLYISVSKNYILVYIWLGGMIFNFGMLLYSNIRLNISIKNKVNNDIFNLCCEKLGIKADLYINKTISSPMSFGVLRKKVVLPRISLNNADFENIIIHELMHHKHNDILINYFMCFINAVYWFNPVVYLVLNKIRLDIEIYCDYSVIKYTKDNVRYGNTIINMAASDSKFKIASYMAAKNNNIKVRILKIVGFDKVYSPRPAVFFIMLATVISFISLFCINTFGYTSPYYLDNVNYTQNNFEEFFEGKKGTFVLYDTNKQKYTIYNEDMARKRVSPCSTYKIAMALNGLEEGVITGNKNKMSWDGVTNPFEEWNKDQNLDSAMKNSVNWYFKNIDKKLNIREIRDFLNKTDYGNKSVIYDKENYWLENSLEISPLEQVIFLNRVVNNDFGFSDENIYTVLNSLKISDCIYGKTGTGMVNGKIVGGWFVSLVERQNNRYVIATRVEYATGAEAEDITMNILDKMNILDSYIL